MPASYKAVVEQIATQWESDTGFFYELTPSDLTSLAQSGASIEADIGKYVTSIAAQKGATMQAQMTAMPWAGLGMTKDTYESLAASYGTEFKKITGSDITPDQLTKAFASVGAGGGLGLLSSAQYSQQLMNDTSIQKTYGWVKYGMDFNAWTQQKLSMQTSFGRSINDSEAATILQYNKAASGSNMGVTAKQTGQQSQQQPAGVGGSVVR